MSLFDNLDTPKWISPLDSDKASWQTSSQFGQLFASSLATARQNALMAPMRAAQVNEMEADTKAKQLDIVTKQSMIDAGVQAKQGEAALAGVISSVASDASWHTPETQKRIWEVGKAYPSVMNTPVWAKTWDNIQKSSVAENNLAIAQQKVDLANTRETNLNAFHAQKLDLQQQMNDAKVAGDQQKYDILSQKNDLLQTRIASMESIATNRDQNRLDVQDAKNKGTLEAVQARIAAGVHPGMSLGDKQKDATYKARLHAIWADPTIPTAAAKNAAIDALQKQYGVSDKTTMPNGTATDPLGLFGK